MSFKMSETLGVIACPGGEELANDIIKHLKHIFIRRFEKRAQTLAVKYRKSVTEVVEAMNFDRDQNTSRAIGPGARETRPPSYKIAASYTRFPNGEFKTEILDSVRGMDLYIVQDVENHLPLKFSVSDERYELNVNEHFF